MNVEPGNIPDHYIFMTTYEMKENFRRIYETNLTVKQGQQKLKEWLNHAQVFSRESTSTIENHFEGICTYFFIAQPVE